MPPSQQSHIVFAGGGSGGHLSPGLAIAERMHELDATVEASFLCSRREIDRVMLKEAGVNFCPITASGFGWSPMQILRFLRDYRAGVREARMWMEEKHILRVIALGGFVAAPVVAAARSLNIPATLLNLDRPPGKANRVMARRCDDVWTAIELPDMPGFASEVVGMPVRRRALATGDARECRLRLDLDPDRSTLLITGASQGATSINRMMTTIAASDPAIFESWQVLHLAGPGRDEPVRSGYEQVGVPAVVRPFLHEMGLAWGAATLAISRAGASSVAEVAANAVPAVFIPYPHHRDQHQVHNARPLVDLGGAEVITEGATLEETAEELGSFLQSLMQESDRLHAMRTALQAHRPEDAALRIAQRLLSVE